MNEEEIRDEARKAANRSYKLKINKKTYL